MNHLLNNIMANIKISDKTQAKELTKISFEDKFKQQCILQNNNTLIENRILLGVEKDINGRTVNARMLLTQNEVRLILPHLQKFVNTGDL